MAIADNAKPQIPTSLNLTFKEELYTAIVNKIKVIKPDFNEDRWYFEINTGYGTKSRSLDLHYQIPQGEDRRKYINTNFSIGIDGVSWESIYNQLGLENEYHYDQYEQVVNFLTQSGLSVDTNYKSNEWTANLKQIRVYPLNDNTIVPYKAGADVDAMKEEEPTYCYSNSNLALCVMTEDDSCVIQFTREAIEEKQDVSSGLAGQNIGFNGSDVHN